MPESSDDEYSLEEEEEEEDDDDEHEGCTSCEAMSPRERGWVRGWWRDGGGVVAAVWW